MALKHNPDESLSLFARSRESAELALKSLCVSVDGAMRPLQILVLLANIQAKFLKADVEKVSIVTCIGTLVRRS